MDPQIKPLSVSKDRLATVIVNPATCPTEFEEFEAEVSNYLKAAGYSCEFYRTIETVPATLFAREAIERGTELIIAAGGDGTILDVVNALIGVDIPLGIIPLGTGNLLAINLGIPFVVIDALRSAVTGSDRRIDIVKVNSGENFFAIMGGIGFDAKVMDGTDRMSKHLFGRMAYIWTAIRNLEGELFDAIVTFDGAEGQSVQARSILIANMGFLGPGLNAFPNADPESGQIQVGILKASNAGDFVRLVATAVIEGSPSSDSSFDVYSCKSLNVKLPFPQPFEYDGNVVGDITEVTVEVVPRALRVRVPTVKGNS